VGLFERCRFKGGGGPRTRGGVQSDARIRANIAQNFYRPRPSFYRFTVVLPTRANSRRAASYAAHTPQIVQRHCLTRPATRPRHAAPRRAPRTSSPLLLPLAHDLLRSAAANLLAPAPYLFSMPYQLPSIAALFSAFTVLTEVYA